MQACKAQLKSLGRIKDRADFLKINKNGTKWVSHGLIVQAMENGLDQTRSGFTVTKKTDKSAVVRNRIKRRLRAVAADILPVHARPGCDYVLIGRAATQTRDYETLKNDLVWCLKKMGFARNHE